MDEKVTESLILGVLHWDAEAEQWCSVSWREWGEFKLKKTRWRHLTGISGGIQHFVVVVRDLDRSVVNIIPHRYLVNPDGSMGHDNFGGLTKEERDDWDRIMVTYPAQPGDDERLRSLQEKVERTWTYPKAAVAALPAALGGIPENGCAAATVFAEMQQRTTP